MEVRLAHEHLVPLDCMRICSSLLYFARLSGKIRGLNPAGGTFGNARCCQGACATHSCQNAAEKRNPPPAHLYAPPEMLPKEYSVRYSPQTPIGKVKGGGHHASLLNMPSQRCLCYLPIPPLTAMCITSANAQTPLLKFKMLETSG